MDKKKFKKIKPLKNLSLVDKVELRLIEFFKENNLGPGDAIPKEMEFAESLGVSRTVVREAFLRLRTLGLVESKKHRGMILTQPDFIDNFERVLDPKLLGIETLKNLYELRLILEMGMADSLYARKTEKDIDELEKIVAKAEGHGIDNSTFSLEHEIQFHGKLYQMSRNVTLQALFPFGTPPRLCFNIRLTSSRLSRTLSPLVLTASMTFPSTRLRRLVARTRLASS